MNSNNTSPHPLKIRIDAAIKNGAMCRNKQLRPRDHNVYLQNIIAAHKWPEDAIAADSPHKIVEPHCDHHLLQFRLYEESEILWIAPDPCYSGHQHHALCFRTVTNWKLNTPAIGSYICPNPFNPNVISRSNRNVSLKKYFVVRSTGLGRDEVGSIFRWMTLEKLRLRAVVDTVSNGLEGWFDYPDPGNLNRVNRTLAALTCDPNMFSPSHPCALPGSLNGGQYCRIIYFDL